MAFTYLPGELKRCIFEFLPPQEHYAVVINCSYFGMIGSNYFTELYSKIRMAKFPKTCITKRLISYMRTKYYYYRWLERNLSTIPHELVDYVRCDFPYLKTVAVKYAARNGLNLYEYFPDPNLGMQGAARGGHRDLIYFFLRKNYNYPNLILRNLVRSGHLELMEEFEDIDKHDKLYYIMGAAARLGNNDLFYKYEQTMGKDSYSRTIYEHCLAQAFKSNNEELVDYLIPKVNMDHYFGLYYPIISGMVVDKLKIDPINFPESIISSDERIVKKYMDNATFNSLSLIYAIAMRKDLVDRIIEAVCVVDKCPNNVVCDQYNAYDCKSKECVFGLMLRDAAKTGDVELVRYFLRDDCSQENLNNALYDAAKNNYQDIMEILLTAGAEPRMAVMAAAKYNFRHIIDRYPDCVDVEILEKAVKHNFIDLVKYFMDKLIKTNISLDKLNLRVAETAIRLNRQEILKYFMSIDSSITRDFVQTEAGSYGYIFQI